MLDAFLDSLAIEPRPYQRRILAKAAAMFSGQFVGADGTPQPVAHSIMIESPTGSGKTVMGLALARWLQQTRGFSVGWVAMRRNLLLQARIENASRGFDVEMHTISMFDKHPPRVDLLVLDEAQHDGAQSMADLHSAVQPQKILGLSATPYRSDRVRLCFDKVIADAGIHQLIQEGYLAEYHHYSIPRYTPESVAETYLREPARWGQTLVFFHTHDQCLQFQALLRDAGVAAEVVTASSNRDHQIEDFRAGRRQVLINMAILTEGFDCPSLKTVFCRPSGKGPTVQMGGRVFRQHPKLPYKQIVQCAQTRHPMTKTATPCEQYTWTPTGWKSLKRNARIDEITQRTLRVIATSQVELPDVVRAARTRQQVPFEQRADQLANS